MMTPLNITTFALAAALVAGSSTTPGCTALERIQQSQGDDTIQPISDFELKRLSAEAIGEGLTPGLVEISEVKKGFGNYDRPIEFQATDARNGRVYGMFGKYVDDRGDYYVKNVGELVNSLTPEQKARKAELAGDKP